MEQNWGEYWPFILAAGALGAFLAPIIGYFHRPRKGNGHSSSTVSGAAIVDSAILERVAVALEGLLEIERARDKRKAAERHDSELETLRREIDDLKHGKR